MSDGFDGAVAALQGGTDPRLDEAYWRAIPATDEGGGVILVGVVHDHPASVHRVETVVDVVAPDVVALELPSLAVPYFERAASDDSASTARTTDEDEPSSGSGDSGVPATDGGIVDDSDESVDGDGSKSPGRTGGEMSAAIAAAEAAAVVVAVDTFDWRFFGKFAQRARAEAASLSTVRSALADVYRVTRHALSVRATDRDERPDRGTASYDVTADDDPHVQASDERTQVSRSESLLSAFERPPADVLLDETREANMAANIDAQRRAGVVVAVVGMDHLDRVAAKLD